MIIVVYNKSRKRRLKKTKRILSSVLFPINQRLHIGNIPSRTIIDLIKKIKLISGQGLNVKIFIESKEGYNGFKLIQIGKQEEQYEYLELSNSKIDEKLIKDKIIKKIPNFFDKK